MATTFETSISHEDTRSLSERFADWLVRSSLPVQRNQMIHALESLDNALLAKIGITRDEIPAYAHRIIYRGV